MDQPTLVDLTNSSFDEFVSFLFDREIPPEEPKQDPWEWNLQVEFDAETICSYYMQLFRQPEFLLTRFTKIQLEAGFWALLGPNLDCSVYRIIHESELPLSIRQECIRSMYELFKRLFATESLDTSVHMWWDCLCYDWHCGNRRRERGGEDLELQNVFFETLVNVLAINSPICQGSALHGLGHLHHPDTPQLIERYIQEHPKLTEERIAYARATAKFEVR